MIYHDRLIDTFLTKIMSILFNNYLHWVDLGSSIIFKQIEHYVLINTFFFVVGSLDLIFFISILVKYYEKSKVLLKVKDWKFWNWI
jgi:hypothetical protein